MPKFRSRPKVRNHTPELVYPCVMFATDLRHVGADCVIFATYMRPLWEAILYVNDMTSECASQKAVLIVPMRLPHNPTHETTCAPFLVAATCGTYCTLTEPTSRQTRESVWFCPLIRVVTFKPHRQVREPRGVRRMRFKELRVCFEVCAERRRHSHPYSIIQRFMSSRTNR